MESTHFMSSVCTQLHSQSFGLIYDFHHQSDVIDGNLAEVMDFLMGISEYV